MPNRFTHENVKVSGIARLIYRLTDSETGDYIDLDPSPDRETVKLLNFFAQCLKKDRIVS